MASGVERPRCTAWARMSTSCSDGGSAAPARRGSDRRTDLPRATLCSDSNEGVADPSSTGTLADCARTTARSRAE